MPYSLCRNASFTITGMPLQRTPNGFIAKRMRRVAIDDLHPTRAAGLVPPGNAIGRPTAWSLSVYERAPGCPLPRTALPSLERQQGSEAAAGAGR